ncbi:putative 2-phosphosulfolactate phosphatase [subsurface metagenome]
MRKSREVFSLIKINLEFTAKDTGKAVKRKDVIIVIDVLRCTSTIITALANGAKGVIPVKTINEAREIHRQYPNTVLAGERKGIKPKGFYFGNSPLEFHPTKVDGKNIILTTTNGTKTLTKTKGAAFVFIGAFLNINTVTDAALRIAKRENCGLSLVLSGRRGKFSLEDYLCAGAMLERFTLHQIDASDAAFASLLTFQQVYDSLTNIIFQGHHAQYLKSIGLEEDVRFCCKQNRYKLIPYLKGKIITPFKKK